MGKKKDSEQKKVKKLFKTLEKKTKIKIKAVRHV